MKKNYKTIGSCIFFIESCTVYTVTNPTDFFFALFCLVFYETLSISLLLFSTLFRLTLNEWDKWQSHSFSHFPHYQRWPTTQFNVLNPGYANTNTSYLCIQSNLLILRISEEHRLSLRSLIYDCVSVRTTWKLYVPTADKKYLSVS